MGLMKRRMNCLSSFLAYFLNENCMKHLKILSTIIIIWSWQAGRYKVIIQGRCSNDISMTVIRMLFVLH